jgi:hypothetical protein
MRTSDQQYIRGLTQHGHKSARHAFLMAKAIVEMLDRMGLDAEEVIEGDEDLWQALESHCNYRYDDADYWRKWIKRG